MGGVGGGGFGISWKPWITVVVSVVGRKLTGEEGLPLAVLSTVPSGRRVWKNEPLTLRKYACTSPSA